MIETNNKDIEKRLLNDLLEKNKKELLQDGYRLDDLGIKRISGDVFAFFEKKNNNIIAYLDSRGDKIMSLRFQRKRPSIGLFLDMVGYVEVRKGNEIMLFDKADLIKRGNSYVPIEGRMQVDKFSIEYYRIWDEAILYYDRWYLEALSKKDKNGKLLRVPHENLESMSKNGHLHISDLENFLKNKQIGKKDFDIYIKRLLKPKENKTIILQEQLEDYRLSFVGQQITSNDIDSYLKKGYINKDEHKRYIETIMRREKLLDLQKRVRTESRKELEKIKR